MTGGLYYSPRANIFVNGSIVPNGTIEFFVNGGLVTPKAVYSDAALTTSLGSVVRANSAGDLVNGSGNSTPVYLASGKYTIRVRAFGTEGEADGAVLYTQDNIMGIPAASDIDYTAPYTGAVAEGLDIYLNESFNRITPEMCGAVGDGATDDSAAFTTMFSRSGYVQLGAGKRYLFSSGITVTDKTIDMDMNGATIVQNGNFEPITFVAAYSTPINVTGITMADVVIDNDAGNTTYVSVLAVASSTGYAKGDIVRVFSDDLGGWSSAGDKERRGEFAWVSATTSTSITLTAPLSENYTTGIKVSKMNKDLKLNIRNGYFDYSANGPSTWWKNALLVTGYNQPRFENLECIKSVGNFIQLRGCLEASSRNIRANNCRTLDSIIAYGYGLIEYSCEGGSHESIQAYNVRHAYTTGCLASEVGDTAPEYHGRTKFAVISNGICHHAQNAAWDTHPDAAYIMFVNCIAWNSFRGGEPSTATGFQGRGNNISFINCIGYGAPFNFQPTGTTISCLGMLMDGCQYYYQPKPDLDVRPIRINGSGSNRIGITIRDCLISGADNVGTFDIRANQADIILEGTNTIKVAHSSATSASRKVLSLTACTMKAEKIVVDITGSTAVVDIIDINDANCVWSVDQLDVISDASDLRSLVDGGSFATTGIIRKANLTVAPTQSNGTLNGGTGTYIDWEINGNAAGNGRAYTTQTWGTNGVNRELAVDFRSSPVLFFDVVCNATTNSVTTITAGAFNGQQLVIANSNSSTQSFTIAGAIGFGASAITLAAGQSFRAILMNNVWRSA